VIVAAEGAAREELTLCSMEKLCSSMSLRSKEPPNGLGDERRAPAPMTIVKLAPMPRAVCRPTMRCGMVESLLL